MKIKKLLQLGASFVVAISSLFIINIGQAFATVHNCTWTGATNNNFNTATNWSNCNSVSPQDGDTIVFDNTSLGADTTLTNDMTGLSVSNITFQGSGTHTFTLTGNTIGLTGPINDSMTGLCGSSTCVVTIGTNLDITGAQALNLTGILSISGNITGSGLITFTDDGTLRLSGDNSGFSGGITVGNNKVEADSATALGTGTTTVADSGELIIGFDASETISTPLVISGNGQADSHAIYLNTINEAGDNSVLTWSGPITLGSDVAVGGFGYRSLKISGNLSGNYTIAPDDPANDSNATVFNGSPNNSSKTPSGYVPVTVISTDSHPSWGETIVNNMTFINDGVRGDTTVQSGGTLEGSGTVGALSVNSGGTVAPGHSPGCLNSSNLNIAGSYQAELGGTTACSGYDQLNVTGTVTLSGTLVVSLYGGYKPSVGDTYTIIKNDGSDVVSGTFANLPEGATFTVSGYLFQITYKGGDGNDVVLSAKSVPSTPDTGFGFIGTHPMIGLIGASLMAGGFYGLSRRAAPARRR